MRRFKTATQLLCSAVVIATSIVPQTLAGVASCDDTQNTNFQVNGSGATLFVDFLRVPQATNDFIDADGDGCYGFFDSDGDTIRDRIDQLAPSARNGFWVVQYRSIGSIEGFQEFIDFQTCGDLPESPTSERGVINTVDFCVAGVPLGPGCGDDTDGDSIANASGTPVCPTSVDFANTDVPGAYAIRVEPALTNAWTLKPKQTGYGANPVTSKGKPAQTGQSNKLATLTGACSTALNTNVASPDANTIYDTPIAWSPVGIIVNRGVGLDVDNDGIEDGAIRYTDLRHGFVTGRMRSGENLIFATRDSGSGTRNAAMNSIGVDPSRGIGENVGVRINANTLAQTGPDSQASNLGGSGIMEVAIENQVLAIGYTGIAGSSRSAQDARAGLYELAGVIKDASDCGGLAGAQIVRPTLDAMLDNGDPNTGWEIGGVQTLITRGNPRAHDFGVRAPQREAGTLMSNVNAAKFVRNITESIALPDPLVPLNANMPGEYLARNFLLVRAVDTYSNPGCPIKFDQTELDPAIQLETRNTSVLRPGGSNEPPTYGDNDLTTTRVAGRAANRRAPVSGTYRDGGTTAYRYWDGTQFRTIISSFLSRRNRLAGDMNNDGLRNVNDIEKFVDAHYSFQVNGADATLQNFEAIQGGATGSMFVDRLIVHVVGDMNADGEFNQEDIRHFADGEAIDPVTHKLDRKNGFIRADARWQTVAGNLNLFGVTAKSTGHAYKAGDARGDVFGSATGPAAGSSPIGWNNVLDCNDLNYICQNFTNDWANTDLSIGKDLSCDMNGDLKVDYSDVVEFVVNIMDTQIGDVNLDGVINAADEAIVLANLNTAGCYCNGDVNGDGVVDNADLTIVRCASTLTGDANCDGSVNNFDIDSFVAGILNLGSPTAPAGYTAGQSCWDRRGCWGDANHDNAFNNFDIDSFVTCILSSPAPGTACP